MLGTRELYRPVSMDSFEPVANINIDLNHLIREEKLQRGSFVRIQNFQTNEVKGKKWVKH